MQTPTVMPLQELYLNAIVAVAQADKLESVIQSTGDTSGRLWFVRNGTTIPHAMMQYEFNLDSVALGLIHRDERKHAAEVFYAEGLDGYLQIFQKFLRANLLQKPRAA